MLQFSSFNSFLPDCKPLKKGIFWWVLLFEHWILDIVYDIICVYIYISFTYYFFCIHIFQKYIKITKDIVWCPIFQCSKNHFSFLIYKGLRAAHHKTLWGPLFFLLRSTSGSCLKYWHFRPLMRFLRNRIDYKKLVGWPFPPNGWVKDNVDGPIMHGSRLASSGGLGMLRGVGSWAFLETWVQQRSL